MPSAPSTTTAKSWTQAASSPCRPSRHTRRRSAATFAVPTTPAKALSCTAWGASRRPRFCRSLRRCRLAACNWSRASIKAGARRQRLHHRRHRHPRRLRRLRRPRRLRPRRPRRRQLRPYPARQARLRGVAARTFRPSTLACTPPTTTTSTARSSLMACITSLCSSPSRGSRGGTAPSAGGTWYPTHPFSCCCSRA